MSDGVMIAFLPTDGSWCKQPLPHMTLVYAGAIEDHEYTAFNALAKDAITIANMMMPFELPVKGIEVFGDEDRVDVLSLGTTPELLKARDLVEHWNRSEFKEFKPHCTIGVLGSARGLLPTRLFFDRIIVSFGNENMEFRLGGYDSINRRARSDY